MQLVAEEDVVAEDQAHRIGADEVRPERERLGDAAGIGLHLVRQRKAQVPAVAEQPLDERRVARRADDQDLADAGQHEDAERVVDDRLVVDGQELLADRLRERIEPGAAAAGEKNALHELLRFER